MAAFLIISFGLIVFTSKTPEEWKEYFKKLEE